MKNSEYVIRFCPVPCYQLGAIGEYLEKMAAKGLIFVGKRGIKFRFHKEAPQKLHFCATVFDKASEYDTRAESDTLDYLEYCGAEGWEYICTDGKVQYFRSAQAEPVPIETDPAAALKQIHRAFWKRTLLTPLLLVLLGVFDAFSGAGFTLDPMETPVYGFCAFLVCVLADVLILTEPFFYLLFYSSNRIRTGRGESIRFRRYGSCVRLAVISWGIFLCGLLILGAGFGQKWLLYGTLVFLAVGAFGFWFIGLVDDGRWETRSREENRFLYFMKSIACAMAVIVCFVVVICIVIFSMSENDEIPFTLEDAGITVPAGSYRDSSAYGAEKYLYFTEESYDDLAYFIYEEEDETDRDVMISYTLYSFRNEDALQRWLTWQEQENGWELTEAPDAASVWQAQSAYYLKGYPYDDDYVIRDEYLIVYDDTVLQISANLVNCPELYGVLTRSP